MVESEEVKKLRKIAEDNAKAALAEKEAAELQTAKHAKVIADSMPNGMVKQEMGQQAKRPAASAPQQAYEQNQRQQQSFQQRREQARTPAEQIEAERRRDNEALAFGQRSPPQAAPQAQAVPEQATTQSPQPTALQQLRQSQQHRPVRDQAKIDAAHIAKFAQHRAKAAQEITSTEPPRSISALRARMRGEAATAAPRRPDQTTEQRLQAAQDSIAARRQAMRTERYQPVRETADRVREVSDRSARQQNQQRATTDESEKRSNQRRNKGKGDNEQGGGGMEL